MSESTRPTSTTKPQQSQPGAAAAAPAPQPMPQNAPNGPIGETGAPDAAADILSPKQWLAIELMAAGRSLAQVAAHTGVDRKTLYRWRHHDTRFVAELRARRRALFDGAADRLAALLPQAVEVLSLHLSDPSDRASFHAATAILRIANIKELLTDDGDDEGDGAADDTRDLDDAAAQL